MLNRTGRTNISLFYSKPLHFSCISEVWVTVRFDVLFKSLNVTKTINIFLAHIHFFEKATNFFKATGHLACRPDPYQNHH